MQHYAWKPDGSAIAYATADEPANKKEIEKGNDAFEVGNNDFLTQAAPQPVHVWLVSADGGTGAAADVGDVGPDDGAAARPAGLAAVVVARRQVAR